MQQTCPSLRARSELGADRAADFHCDLLQRDEDAERRRERGEDDAHAAPVLGLQPSVQPARQLVHAHGHRGARGARPHRDHEKKEKGIA